MERVAIVAAARTPIGQFLGSFADLPAAELGGFATRGVLLRAGIAPAEIGELIFGCARQAGGGPNMARQVLMKSGIPEDRPAFTVNQAAGSTPCSYSVGTNNLTVEAAGGPATIAVTAGSTCAWTASSNAGWITVTSGASGTGNGTVTISIARNTGNDRKGTVTIAGKTVTIEQKEEKKGK